MSTHKREENPTYGELISDDEPLIMPSSHQNRETREADVVNNRIRIAIADRHENFREACKRILGMEPDMEMVSESGTGFGLCPLLDLMKADVLLFDEKLEADEGQESFRLIREQFPKLKIIYMVSSEDQAGSVDAVRLGVNGVIEKGKNTAYLPKAIRKIVDGEVWISRKLTSALMKANLRHNQDFAVSIE